MSIFHRMAWCLFCLGAACSGCDTKTGPPAVPGAGIGRRVVPDVSEVHDARRAAVAEAAEHGWFEDVTKRTGIDFTYRNGREAGRFYLIESFGGGIPRVRFARGRHLGLFFPRGRTYGTE